MAGKHRRQVPIHYQRANHISWAPPAVFSFDTETVTAMDGDNEVLTLRLWCARFTDRRAPKRGNLENYADEGEFADDIAFAVHRFAKARKTAWGYAHNLGFDLCTSMLVENLGVLGWEVTEFAVSGTAPFVRMRHGDSCLTLSDSWSWTQTPLADMGDAVGIQKPPLPDEDDSKEAWFTRCRADVNILHTAMLTLMDWWEKHELGRWNVTGSASGWNAMRHIPAPQRILIRPDDDECDHDRSAIYGGRRYTWRSGHTQYGHFTEVDIVKAYTNAARHFPLPVERIAPFTTLSNDHKWLDCKRWGVIAECVLHTDRPLYPVRVNRHVWYPVGTFTTTLAGPELREARDTGHLLRVGSGWLHKMGFTLRPWAAWCIESMADESGQTPDIAKMVHRVWARSSIGKYAQRGHEVIHLGPAPNRGWNYEEAWHHAKACPAAIIDFAGERYQVAAVAQSDNAYPAILAFVESYVRAALNRAISHIPDKHIVACDTDGYICDAVGADATGDINRAIAPFEVRQKRHFKRVQIIGPQHMTLDGNHRRSGIPPSAQMGDDGRLHARIWPKLAWQLEHGRQGAYIRPQQAYKLAATYATGWLLDDGSVVPVEMTTDAAGVNSITPFPLTAYAASGRVLGPDQNRHLRRYQDV